MKLPLLAFIIMVSAGNINAGKRSIETGNNRKIALVVGVTNYLHAAPLKNAANDATDMGSSLTRLGFDVQKLIDPTAKEFSQVLNAIQQLMNEKSDFVFFYSGHGMEYRGENYLFLKNTDPYSTAALPATAYQLEKILEKCAERKVKNAVFILDACQIDHPTAKKGFIPGISSVKVPYNTFVGFAGTPGKAAPSEGKNSPFTEALLKYIEDKDLSIDELFGKVNESLRKSTGNKQIPYMISSLDQEFYFSTCYNK